MTYSQRNVLDSDPLSARKQLIYDQVGVYAGLSSNGQLGTIVTDCNCEFTGGAQTGFAAGLMFERLTRGRYTWGVTFGYENKSVEGQFKEVEGVVQSAPSSGQQYTVPITFQNTANASVGFLTGMPFIKYEFFELLYVRAGATLSYVVSSGLKHTKALETDTVRFPNGETASVSIPNSESGSVVLQDGPIEGINNFQAGIALAAGMDLRLSKYFFLSPVVQYVHPLTKITDKGGGFSVNSFQILVEGRLIL